MYVSFHKSRWNEASSLTFLLVSLASECPETYKHWRMGFTLTNLFPTVPP